MRRRVITSILFIAVAIYGTGLPQLVHHLVDHQGWGSGTVAGEAHAGCCSHSCTLASSSSDNNTEHDGGCDDTHSCDICSMLATLHAATPALVQVMQLHGDSPQPAVVNDRLVALSARFDPHSPRGPPAHHLN